MTDIFPVNSVGIVTARDSLAIHFTADSVVQTVKRFAALSVEEAREKFQLGPDSQDWTVLDAQKDVTNSKMNAACIVPIAYRPFDMRFTYFTGKSKGFHCRARGEVMRHMLIPNIALISAKQSKDDWGVFLSPSVGGHKACVAYDINNFFPLWLEPDQLDPAKPLSAQIKPNLAPDFVNALGSALDLQLGKPHGIPKGITPEDVLAYIYAVMHATSYRALFASYLKSDFPRIPLNVHAGIDPAAAKDFPSVWRALMPLGKELLDLHLLKSVPAKLQVKFPAQGNNEVEKPRYEIVNGKGRVWINATQYFDGVPSETWLFKVGGYQVCEKWLKDRKGRELSFDDIQHYGKVVAALTRTRALMQEIDAVANGVLWPESAVATLTAAQAPELANV